jgi:hypothetical protein
MRRSLWIAILLASPGFAAHANDGMDSSLKAKAMASAAAPSTIVTPTSQAPFLQARDPLPALLLLDEQERRITRGGTCQHSTKDLCYDLAEGRISYRPIRQYMPRMEGLTPESISVRHDRVVFKYSFR